MRKQWIPGSLSSPPTENLGTRLASYTLCESHNGLSKLLQASYTLCGGQNGLTELLKASSPTRFLQFITDSPNYLKHPTRFAKVKTDSELLQGSLQSWTRSQATYPSN